MGDFRYLNVAVEISARELESKLLLSLVALSRGFSVIMGEDDFFKNNISKLPLGIFFDKSFTRHHYKKHLAPAKSAGHFVAAIDEEGCESRADPLMFARFHRDSLDIADIIFAWGENQAGRLSERSPNNRHKIVATGSQRWDLLRPEGLESYRERVGALRQVFGDFLLVNSSFTLANNAQDFDQLLRNKEKNGSLDTSDPDQVARMARRRDYQACCMKALLAGIRALALNEPERSIVVRPHPVERAWIWRRELEDLGNVHVIRQGSAEPWILASHLLIVSGCTTGMQALTMRRPVVSFCPDDDIEFRDDSLTNLACPSAGTLEEFVCECGKAIADPEWFRPHADRGLELLREHIGALSGRLAAERMVEVFEKAVGEKSDYVHRRPWSPDDHDLDLRNRRPQNPKFPAISREDVVARLDYLRKSYEIAAVPQVSQIREKVFLIA